MKKLTFIIGIILALSSCKYEDYMFNEHEFTSVSFAIPDPVRTVIPGEDEDIKTGVVIGGMRTTTNEEYASYVIDETLLADYPQLQLMPAEYYTLSDATDMIIPKGQLAGSVSIEFDMEALMNDPMGHTPTYAIPMRITETSLDSILSDKDFTITVIKYINEYHGVYAHKGVDSIYIDGVLDTAMVYSEPDLVKNKTWKLLTESNNMVVTPGLGSLESGSANYAMNITLNEDNSVELTDNDASSVTGILQGDECTYNADKKELYLQYQFTEAGKLHSVHDTLIFRSYDINYETWGIN
ncbi:MAG: DUF1735 domain-containing protein [Bacteroidales bacterium]|nr:DUF1735 domain-containing protein [Bacteroidales bacterium]